MFLFTSSKTNWLLFTLFFGFMSINVYAQNIAPKTKQSLFFDKLKPVVEQENSNISELREKIKKISMQGSSITEEEKQLLKVISVEYKEPINGQADEQWFTAILNKINVIPVDLVLAQAADESAWGTSRFAMEDNNYFGLWCFHEHCGVIPHNRPQGQTYEVSRFDSINSSIHAYFMNINSKDSYKELRQLRMQLTQKKDDLQSKNAALTLADGLQEYSSRSTEYVSDVKKIITHYF